MVAKFVVTASAFVPLLLAQQLPQRSRLSDYPVHAQLPHFELGAYFLAHDLPTEKTTYSPNDYLVVEVAIFPAEGERVHVSNRDFTLRINDKKVVDAASPQSVAASLRYSNFDQPTALPSGGGIGDAGVAGIPGGAGRLPGDTNPGAIPQPSAPLSRNNTDDPYSAAPNRDLPVERAVADVALVDGAINRPTKGDLFFRFGGKVKSIHSLDLVYTDDKGAQTTIPLIKAPEK